jgi:hypothetical protein|eukprot:COSAG02_NODE_2864_length_7872_cov_5.266692_5_plen_57_part_00
MCVHTVQHALPSTQQIVGPDGRELVGMKIQHNSPLLRVFSQSVARIAPPSYEFFFP